MGRLSNQLIRRAHQLHPLLPLIIRETRDVAAARRELKWIADYVANLGRPQFSAEERLRLIRRKHLTRLAIARSRGEPIQYLLGSEYFGPLELLCRRGVLIPRQDTALYVQYLLERIASDSREGQTMRSVLDLCSGSGCISLLVASLWHSERLFGDSLRRNEVTVLGIDISAKAVRLARQNRRKVYDTQLDSNAAKHTVASTCFMHGNVFSREDPKSRKHLAVPNLLECLRKFGRLKWDVLICNPPYISPVAFKTVTTRSVRHYEPKLALVPSSNGVKQDDVDRGDSFYPAIMSIAQEVEAKCVLVEVGDAAQAMRVARMMQNDCRWLNVEIWREEPCCQTNKGEIVETYNGIPIRGQGLVRSVYCHT